MKPNMKQGALKSVLLAAGLILSINIYAQQPYLQSQAYDVSRDFGDFSNTYFFADKLADLRPEVENTSATGYISWKRHSLYARQAFNTTTVLAQPLDMLDFPESEYINDPKLPFRIDFIDDRTVRVRVYTSPIVFTDEPSLMLAEHMRSGYDGEYTFQGGSAAWQYEKHGKTHIWKGPEGWIGIDEDPFRIILYNKKGGELTDTRHWKDNDSTQIKALPFNFIKRASDNRRSINPVFAINPYEKIVGCGESPTALNKVGQKLNLFVTDPQSPESDQMYKPVPFYFSSKGYGVFMHTSAPVTCDFGATNAGAAKLFLEDEVMDFFFFIGKPKEILESYTYVTGRSPMPPKWSFGTWMSRISYFSAEEGLDVAANLRAYEIPADVIHFDTGWFETDWECDYEFDTQRFPDVEKMMNEFDKMNFKVSLWQLPYFTPKNRYYRELISEGYYVRNDKGGLPYEDVVLDFSNPEAVEWYQEKLAGLFDLGVDAIKVDFGEGAPLEGIYASGKTGLYEHNLYPLRYNKAVADITLDKRGENIIWARSAWAGSQRYPLHWGGDAANTNMGMAATLRCGLSFGLSGFSFWSHDIGGFVVSTPSELYRRWLPFGFLSSHTRAHGAPPTEPWLYSQNMVDEFKRCAELKYKLMPYILDQAQICSETGLPMVRAMLVEYPEDPGCWTVDDQYLFGSDILVAPLMDSNHTRYVYLPEHNWVDYQTKKTYKPGWNEIEVDYDDIPCVILVREGAEIPHIPAAQSTEEMDFSRIYVTRF